MCHLRYWWSIRALGLLSVASCCLVGCTREADIGHYQTPQESVGETVPEATVGSGTPQRMLAAIVPDQEQVWFFKVMGPVEQVEGVAVDVRRVLESLTFDSQRQPQWTLPDGWTSQPGNAFRHATLVAPSGLELAVSRLSAPGGEASPSYILENINRWRGQLQLAPIAADEMSAAAESLQLADRACYAVDLVGSVSGNMGMPAGHPPMSSTDLFSGASGNAVSPSISTARPASGLSYDTPEGWQAGSVSSMRLASFTVERDGQSAEITVIALGPSSGTLLDNVNRWRQQILLPPVAEGELNELMSTVEIGEIAVPLVKLEHPEAAGQQAIHAVVISLPEKTIFVKMMGAQEVVQAEAKAFEQFSQSLRFTPRSE